MVSKWPRNGFFSSWYHLGLGKSILQTSRSRKTWSRLTLRWTKVKLNYFNCNGAAGPPLAPPPWSVVYLRASRRHLGLEGSDVAIVFTHSMADLVDVGFLDARQAHGRSSSKLKKVNTLALILVLHAKGTLQIRDQIWFWYFSIQSYPVRSFLPCETDRPILLRNGLSKKC